MLKPPVFSIGSIEPRLGGATWVVELFALLANDLFDAYSPEEVRIKSLAVIALP